MMMMSRSFSSTSSALMGRAQPQRNRLLSLFLRWFRQFGVPEHRCSSFGLPIYSPGSVFLLARLRCVQSGRGEMEQVVPRELTGAAKTAVVRNVARSALKITVYFCSLASEGGMKKETDLNRSCSERKTEESEISRVSFEGALVLLPDSRRKEER
ncbi:hypothetical protein B0J14DRAFT_192754 [Halenospora varia]|nr:hypothetical protein B0J14DRAFT_192754 [Halenospora varia]